MVNYCLALPILPGEGMELAKKFALEHGGHTKEHDDFSRSLVLLKKIWIQRSPPGSGAPDLEIVSIETNNPANTFKEFATSNHPWAVRFRDYAKKAFGIDYTGPPPPPNENIVDWQEEKQHLGP
jgi:hypothetical protein